MREKGKGSRRWFFVNSKSFEFSVEGEGRKLKVIIIERSRGRVSWIRFGEEGLKTLLKRVEFFISEATSKKEALIGRSMEEGTVWIARKMKLDVVSSTRL